MRNGEQIDKRDCKDGNRSSWQRLVILENALKMYQNLISPNAIKELLGSIDIEYTEATPFSSSKGLTKEEILDGQLLCSTPAKLFSFLRVI